MFLRRNMAGFASSWGYRRPPDWMRPKGSTRSMSMAELKALNTPEAQQELAWRARDKEYREAQVADDPARAAARRRAGTQGPEGARTECAPGFSVEEERTGEINKRSKTEVVRYHLLKDGVRTGRFYLTRGKAVEASYKPYAARPPQQPMVGGYIEVIVVNGKVSYLARKEKIIYGVFDSLAAADAELVQQGCPRGGAKANPYFDNSIHSALIQSDLDYDDPTIVYNVFEDEE